MLNGEFDGSDRGLLFSGKQWRPVAGRRKYNRIGADVREDVA
jgi:hypothetical protein